MSLSSPPEVLLDDVEEQPRVRRRRRRSRWSRFKRRVRHLRREPSRPLLIAFGVVAVFLLACGYRVAEAQRELRAAEDAFKDAKSAVAETRTDDAATSLDEASAHLHAARSAARGFPLGLTTPIPFIGSPSKAAVDVSRAGDELVAAGRVINDAAASFPTSANISLEGHDLRELRSAAQSSLVATRQAARHLEAATNIVDGPSGALVPWISGPARSARGTIADGAGELDGAERGLRLFDELAAPGTNMRVLVVSQDSMELRPSGGYIGSFGILEIKDGHANLSDYRATEDLVRPEPRLTPPPDMAPGYPRWMIEDAGWWPNFPTSAKSIADVFRAQGGGEVDGVLAMTEYALADLVGALGPITVPGYEKPVVKEGFAQRVLYEVELKRPRDTPRKRFLTELSKIVFDRLLSMDGEEMPDVAKALGQAIGAGDVQLWFDDAAQQQEIEDLAVSGLLPRTDRDFLMLVDANLTPGKANAGIVKEVEYVVRRDATGQLVATLSISVRNEGQESPINPHYAGFQRVYVPLGSQLEGDGEIRDEGPASDGRYEVFSLDIFVEPKSERSYQIHYRLPESVAPDGQYRLTWLRQTGTPGDRLTARVGGRSESFSDKRSLSVDATLRRNRVIEWLRDRWLWRKLSD